MWFVYFLLVPIGEFAIRFIGFFCFFLNGFLLQVKVVPEKSLKTNEISSWRTDFKQLTGWTFGECRLFKPTNISVLSKMPKNRLILRHCLGPHNFSRHQMVPVGDVFDFEQLCALWSGVTTGCYEEIQHITATEQQIERERRHGSDSR